MKTSILSIFILSSTFLNCCAFDSEDYSNARLGSTNLCRADLSGADLEEADLKKVDLWGANLWLADLMHANLQETDLRLADLDEANLKHANLKTANLTEAQISEAKLNHANLEGANLTKADLSNSDLRNTNLINSIFCGAKLKSVKLSKTIVHGANFKSCTGLTNKQKKYLRKGGAINVPIDIVYEIDQDPQKVGHEVAVKKNIATRIFNYFLQKITRKKNKNASTQTP